MFAKLLKHDFRSTWGLLGLLSVISLGAGVLGIILARILEATEPEGVWAVIGVLTFVAVVFYLMAYSVAAMFVLLGRFYKSRFTDEGYLTFTLPVTTHQVLLSSFVNCSLGVLFSGIVTVFSFAFMVFFGEADFDGQRIELIGMMFDYLPELLDVAGVGNILLFLLVLLAGFAGELMTIMLAITAGALLAKKHKMLMGVAVYYGLHMVMSTLGVLVLNYFGSALITEMTQDSFVAFFGILALGLTILTVGLYFLMYWLVHKKLNLN